VSGLGGDALIQQTVKKSELDGRVQVVQIESTADAGSAQAQSPRVWVGDDPTAKQIADVGGGDGVGAIPGRHHHLVDTRPEGQVRGEVEQLTAPKVLGELVGDSCALKAAHSATLGVSPVRHQPITARTPITATTEGCETRPHRLIYRGA
jgi:hypothetical protein